MSAPTPTLHDIHVSHDTPHDMSHDTQHDISHDTPHDMPRDTSYDMQDAPMSSMVETIKDTNDTQISITKLQQDVQGIVMSTCRMALILFSLLPLINHTITPPLPHLLLCSL